MGCSDPPLTGVGAPHQCPLGKLAMLPSLYTDVRSMLMVLLAFQRPKNVTKQVNFMRVVHTAETPRILKEISALQGQDGIYYAGSYCVFGMGLLEQAALSGHVAAEIIMAEE